MVARTAATATSRALARRSARQPTRVIRAAALRSQIHTSASLDEVIPGATYVHIPPLEIPADGLVPAQGSNQLLIRIGGENSPSLTVAHSLTIVKAVEAKCGPVVSVHHRRDPVNGTLLKSINVTLLHPVTLKKDLVLEIPCHHISREHRMNGGPSLEELEQAILEPPSSAQSKASGSAQNNKVDTIFVEVKTVAPKATTHIADVYGVYRTAMPVETRPGLFRPSHGHPPRKVVDPRRARKSPEEELQEDEQILSRLMDWKGFYGGFQDFQSAYRPLAQVISPEASRSDRSTGSATRSSSVDVDSISATDLAEQKKVEKQTLEERLAAEREYWRQRREMEKNARRQEESAVANEASSASKPSSTLLKRLLKGDKDEPSPASTASSTETVSPSTSTRTATSAKQSTTPTNAEPTAQLNAAQRRIIEKVIAQNRADASPAGKLKKLITPALQRTDSSKDQSMTTTKGFTGVQREEKKTGLTANLIQWAASWFTQK